MRLVPPSGRLSCYCCCRRWLRMWLWRRGRRAVRLHLLNTCLRCLASLILTCNLFFGSGSAQLVDNRHWRVLVILVCARHQQVLDRSHVMESSAHLAGCLDRMAGRSSLCPADQKVAPPLDQSLGLAGCPGRMARLRCLCLECQMVVQHLIAHCRGHLTAPF